MARRSEEMRWFVVALIGGQVGAAFGLVFFGGLLFVPIVTALAGTAVAPLLVLAGQWLRLRLVGRYLRSALRS